MVTHDKNVYLFGGLGNELCEKLIILQPDNEDTIDKYIWKTIKQIGVTPKGRYGHLSVTNKRDKDIYIMGGARKFNTLTKIRECLNDIYKYNIDSNEWKELICGGSPIEPRRNHAGCIVGKHLFIHGGINQQGAFTKDNAILNLSIKFMQQV
jgi:N-acetylneuraminic acid mutarotase